MADANDNVIGCAGLLFLLVIAWIIDAAFLDSRIRYDIMYGRTSGSRTVTVLKKPRDCDFMTAPLGSKNCTYEADKEVIRTMRNSQGESLVSFDDGATWTPNEFGAKPGVVIKWRKVED